MKPSHQTVRLAAGRHRSPRFGVCVMELASMLSAEPFSDRPRNASPVIGAFLRTYNDGLDDERRQDLYELASLIVDSAGRRAIERERASRCLEFACGLGAGLPAGRGAIGIASAEASGSWAAKAALADGPSAQTHDQALAFAHDLIRLAPRRRSHWGRIVRCDPAGAVREVLAEAEAEADAEAEAEAAGGAGAAAATPAGASAGSSARG